MDITKRTIYLIRHGQPAFPGSQRMCLGRTDLPLSILGQMQAALLGAFFREIPLSDVYCSPLMRTRQTAAAISPHPICVDGLEELDMGTWDMRTFADIRASDPQLYALRGEDPVRYDPPGGEPVGDCRERVQAALDTLLRSTCGDIAVVAHAGVNRLLLTAPLQLPLKQFLTIPQPYGCINRLEWDGETLTVKETGILPHPPCTDMLCTALLQAAQVPQQVAEHCAAVARKARAMGQQLTEVGYPIDSALLHAAAMLHDIAKGQKCHATAGGELLRALGYEDIAALIACHQDFSAVPPAHAVEAALLFLADKYVRETKEVTLAQRFQGSLHKCTTPEALAAHDRRFQQAMELEQLLHRAMGGEQFSLAHTLLGLQSPFAVN